MRIAKKGRALNARPKSGAATGVDLKRLVRQLRNRERAAIVERDAADKIVATLKDEVARLKDSELTWAGSSSNWSDIAHELAEAATPFLPHHSGLCCEMVDGQYIATERQCQCSAKIKRLRQTLRLPNDKTQP